ncbi:MAG: sugar transferase [Candidatus Binatia bacterium]
MLQHTEHFWPHQVLAFATDRQPSFYFIAKRLIDVILATVLLIVLFPLLVTIAILIKLDSRGPVLFVQERVGARRRNEGRRFVWEVRTFPFYKFRSMIQDADQSIHEAYIKAFVSGQVKTTDDPKARFKLTNDPRVTRVGRFLRKTSLDELPQLLNVLRGEMSLVGPRPVPPYEVAGYQARHLERLAALPGITGLWQVKGRCQVPFEEMVQLDISYIHTQSLWLDLKLLFLTIPTVVSRRGAA